MNRRNLKMITLVTYICASLLFLGFGFAIVRESLNSPMERVWQGCYPLLVNPGEEGDAIEGRVSELFPVISSRTARVQYFDFGSFSSVPVNELETRFSPFDSRFDPYMRNLAGYFRSEDGAYRIIYCRSGDNPLRVLIKLRKQLSDLPNSWILIGTNWTVRIILTAIFIIFVLTVLLLPNRRRFSQALFGLPWLPLVFFGPIQMIMAASLFFYAAVLTGSYIQTALRKFLNAGQIKNVKPLLSAVLILWASALFFTLFLITSVPFRRQEVLLILYAVAASMGIELLLAGIILGKRIKQVHILFFYIPLTHTKVLKPQFLKILPAGIMMAVIILLPGFLGRITPEVETNIPRPGAAETGNGGYALLAELDSHKTENSLPDISDFIKHRLYQRGWLYKLPYEIPKPGMRYTISTFRAGEDGIAREEMSVLEVTDSWYGKELEAAPPGGVTELLMSQGGWIPIEYKNITQTAFRRIEIIVYCIAWFAVQFSGLFTFTHLTAVKLYGNKAVELRRQCQAA